MLLGSSSISCIYFVHIVQAYIYKEGKEKVIPWDMNGWSITVVSATIELL